MKRFIIIYLFFTTAFIFSQPEPEWVRRYDNSNGLNTNVSDMKVDKGGNVYLGGSNSQGVITIKYNTQGALKWMNIFDSLYSYENFKMSVIPDDSGNVFVMFPGSVLVSSIKTYRECVTLIKYSSAGELLWRSKFINKDSLFTVCKTMVIDDSSNIYIAAEAYTEKQSSDYATIKFDKNGNYKWSRIYDNPSHVYDTPTSITKDSENNIYVTGRNLISMPVTVKYNSAGDSLWTLKDNSSFISLRIAIDNDMNILLGGNGNSSFSGSTFILKKFNSSRNLLWRREYYNPQVTPNNNLFRDFLIDKNNNVFITGANKDTNELAWDYETIKFNQAGDSVWSRKYSPLHNSDDNPSSLALDNQGNCIVTGKSDNNLASYKYLTIVYSPSGQQKYIFTYNNGFPFLSHQAIKVLTDTSGNIYITGTSQAGTGVIGIATIKYSTLTGIQQTSLRVPEKFELLQNYPNPFNPETNINFKIPNNSQVKIIVYNALGKEVESLIDKNLSAGDYKVLWNASQYSSGVYFYSLFINGKFSASKTSMLIK